MSERPSKGTLWLIPTLLGDGADPTLSLPAGVIAQVAILDHFIVENAKSARAFIKRVAPQRTLQTLSIAAFDGKTTPEELEQLLSPGTTGHDIGVMSEAGLPCIADPGSAVVIVARRMGMQIAPLVGPSSILLALMASGLNGQRFRFLGYLPVDKSARLNAIIAAEHASAGSGGETQMAIETPYRNDGFLADLATTLQPATLLTVAIDLTLPSQSVETRPARAWRGHSPLGKRPAMFLWQVKASGR
jgi:16S rRNA (cytidine1402-2'-O)-methyltransferase